MLFAETATPWSNVAMMFITLVLVPLVAWVIKQQWSARRENAETKKLLNGRMDERVQAAYDEGFARGHAAGVAKVSDAVARSPKISLDAQGVAQAVAAANVATPSA